MPQAILSNTGHRVIVLHGLCQKILSTELPTTCGGRCAAGASDSGKRTYMKFLEMSACFALR